VTPVLCDFGAGSKVGVHEAPILRPGKIGYTSPEVYAFKPYTGSSLDVYSLGVCLFCMLSGRMPYRSPSDDDRCFAVLKKHGIARMVIWWNISARFPKAALSLLAKMVCVDERDRATMEEVAAHEWVSSCLTVASSTGKGTSPSR
jgi:serine/threonine protein kinase